MRSKVVGAEADTTDKSKQALAFIDGADRRPSFV
jgi:hypothetical protein